MKIVGGVYIFFCGFVVTLGVLAALWVVEVICDLDFSCLFSWRP